MNIKERFELSDSFLLGHCISPKPTEFICGMELEIEQVRDFNEHWMEENCVQVETDGSLRNDGREFLLCPARLEQNLALFKELHKCAVDLGPEAFSQRTSTHVHVNVMYSELYQVKNLLLLYSIFEELFFNFVGEERKNNIHCVPLSYTHMSRYYGGAIDLLRSRWHKYTAFNILPLNEKGTVEFRHLEGTKDHVRVEEWLKLIKLLWITAHTRSSLCGNDLMDITWLKELTAQIMTPAFCRQCVVPPTFVVEKNLIDVKLAFL